jgi:hypothetical protein
LPRQRGLECPGQRVEFRHAGNYSGRPLVREAAVVRDGGLREGVTALLRCRRRLVFAGDHRVHHPLPRLPGFFPEALNDIESTSRSISSSGVSDPGSSLEAGGIEARHHEETHGRILRQPS